MKLQWLCSVIVLSATAVSAQTSDASKTISVTGCVASGSKSEPVTLTHAMVLPFGSPTSVPEPGTMSIVGLGFGAVATLLRKRKA